MFEDGDIADIFRGGFPYYVLFALPILIICLSNPTLASSEMTVQRMSQFDINGVTYGCRASVFSLEAKSLYTWSTSRHCVLAKFKDMTIEQFREIRQKAGALVLLLPQDISAMTIEEKDYLMLLEQAMMEQSISIPVFFSSYNSDLESIITDVTRTATKKLDQSSNPTSTHPKQREPALTELFNSISANGYQIIVTSSSHANNRNSKIPIIQGELAPAKVTTVAEGAADASSKLPLIIVAGQLNTFGLYNDYPLNADAAVLMTLAEVFSKMYNTLNAAPKYRLMFLLTESGPLLNFQGVKKWLDENVQLSNVDFVLCLDDITKVLNAEDNQLFMHVSKPPKENTPMSIFFKHLKNVATKYDNMTVEGVHKKINLAEHQLAWQHERFSIKRLSSLTLSSLKTPKHPARTTIFSDNEQEILVRTQMQTKIIAEALARYIYTNSALEGIEDFEIFSGAMQITKMAIKSYLNLKSALINNDLKNAFEKYLKNVKLIYEKPDDREPDFMLYEGSDGILNIYRVKPAVFDLFLTIVICAYFCSVYLLIQFFPNMYKIMFNVSSTSPESSPIHNNYIERNKSKTN